jgi:hypothetical protein
VQVLEDEEQRLIAAFAEEHEANGLRRQRAAPSQVELHEFMIPGQRVEEPQERGDHVLEPLVERDDHAGDLGAHVARVVPIGELEVAPEEIDQGKIGRGLAVGDRGRLEDAPARRAMRAEELVEEPRFPDARLAHHRHELAAAGSRLVARPPQLIELGVAAHEAREAARHRGVEPRAGGANAHHLEDGNGLGEASDRRGAERFHLDVPFGAHQGRLGH